MDEIFWNKITNANRFINLIVSEFKNSLILIYSKDIPWYDIYFRKQIVKEIKKEVYNKSYKHIDTRQDKDTFEDENKFNNYLFEKYCSYDMQQLELPKQFSKFIAENDDGITIHQRYIWVDVCSQKSFENWVNFVSEYVEYRKKHVENNKDTAYFVISCLEQFEFPENFESKKLKVYSFRDYIQSYDYFVFFNLILSNLKILPDVDLKDYKESIEEAEKDIKTYIAEFVSNIIKDKYGKNIEFLAECLSERTYKNFLHNPSKYINNKNIATDLVIENSLLKSQLKIIFPMLEEFRQRVVDKYSDLIKEFKDELNTKRQKKAGNRPYTPIKDIRDCEVKDFIDLLRECNSKSNFIENSKYTEIAQLDKKRDIFIIQVYELYMEELREEIIDKYSDLIEGFIPKLNEERQKKAGNRPYTPIKDIRNWDFKEFCELKKIFKDLYKRSNKIENYNIEMLYKKINSFLSINSIKCDSNSSIFSLFNEYVDIRNYLAHGNREKILSFSDVKKNIYAIRAIPLEVIMYYCEKYNICKKLRDLDKKKELEESKKMDNKPLLSDDMINLYPLQKTLCFELKPIGLTQEHFIKHNIQKKAEDRAEEFKKIKPLMDHIHIGVMESALKGLSNNSDFIDCLKSYKDLRTTNSDSKENKELDKKKEKERKQKIKEKDEEIAQLVAKSFTLNDKYEKLFSDEKNDLLREYYKEDSEQIKLIDHFSDFVSYFNKYDSRIENLYGDKKISTIYKSVAYRLITDNLPIFYANTEKIKYIRKIVKSISLDETFEKIENFANYLTTEDINNYNEEIDKINSKIDNINKQIDNINSEKGKNLKRCSYLGQLYILVDLDQDSDILKRISDDKELIEIINSFLSRINLENFKSIFSNLKDYDPKTTFIKNSKFLEGICKKFLKIKSPYISFENVINYKCYENKECFRKQNINTFFAEITDLADKLFANYENAYKNAKDVLTDTYENNEKKLARTKENELKDSIVRIKDLLESIKKDLEKSEDNKSKDCLVRINKLLESIEKALVKKDGLVKIKESLESIREDLEKSEDNKSKDCLVRIKDLLKFIKKDLLESIKKDLERKDSLVKIKDLLESIKAISTFVSWFVPKIKEKKDYTDFSKVNFKIYNELKPERLAKIDQIYSHVRAYFSLKNFSTRKIRLNFDAKDFLNNWNLQEIKENLGIIFKREENGKTNYYLGIVNKDKFSGIINKDKFYKYSYTEDSENVYRLMIYEKDNEEDSKKDNESDYLITFKNISEKAIHEMVTNDELYLFQIYNQDFSKDSRGNVKMHTKYWNNIFNENENRELKRFYINSKAKLFYRPRSLNKEGTVVHPENTPIVNKNEYRAKDKETSTFRYPLIKDKRYTKDKFLFHVPITINSNSQLKEILEFQDYLKKQLKKQSINQNDLNREILDFQDYLKKQPITRNGLNKKILEFQNYLKKQPITRNDLNKKILEFQDYLKKQPIKELNRKILDKIKAGKIEHIIGISRSRDDLLSATVINLNGEQIQYIPLSNIISECLNKEGNKIIEFQQDYNKLLNKKEAERAKANNANNDNKSLTIQKVIDDKTIIEEWQSERSVKDFKNGYISQAVNKIAKLVVEYNAIVVFEDLEANSEKIDSKIEKSMYEKLQKALVNKLSFLVLDKKLLPKHLGSSFRGYQLTYYEEKEENRAKEKQSQVKQNGIIFYVPTNLTSNIDPNTGFMNCFCFPKDTDDFKEFIEKFSEINGDKEHYEFYIFYNSFKENIDKENAKYKFLKNNLVDKIGEHLLDKFLNYSWIIYSNADYLARLGYAEQSLKELDLVNERWEKVFEEEYDSLGIGYKKYTYKKVNLKEEFQKLFEEYKNDIKTVKREKIIDFINKESNNKLDREQVSKRMSNFLIKATKNKIRNHKEEFVKKFVRLFSLLLQMRNYNKDKDYEYIISPVLKNKKFFLSKADIYVSKNIAEKGLLLVNKIKNCKDNLEKLDLKITDEEWIAHIIGKRFSKGKEHNKEDDEINRQ